MAKSTNISIICFVLALTSLSPLKSSSQNLIDTVFLVQNVFNDSILYHTYIIELQQKEVGNYQLSLNGKIAEGNYRLDNTITTNEYTEFVIENGRRDEYGDLILTYLRTYKDDNFVFYNKSVENLIPNYYLMKRLIKLP